jgi:hypothetical protein
MASSRSFIAIAGLIFGFLVVVHVARIAFEGTGPLHDPFFVGITLVALAAAIWSAMLLRKGSSAD